MAKIFHIVSHTTWEEAKEKNIYEPYSLRDGHFIHCSKADQILEVLKTLFKDCQTDLILLCIDEEKVTSPIKYEVPIETPYCMIEYPHIYGPLNLDAVVEEKIIKRNEHGNFILPPLF
jgi:uncharacterized protein (DUF952 family)